MRLATLSEKEIIMTLIAIALLLLFAFTFGTLLEKIKGPRVVGEILGGMILGGSCLFLLLPALSQQIFFAYPEEGKVLNIFYQLGLIFLMFLSGYNTDIKVDKTNAKTISLVFVGATFLPMAGSIPFFGMFREHFIGSINNDTAYCLVFAIGVAITSIPVISKIFFDMGIMNTKFSNTVLTVSTFQDLCLWILLNVATKIAQSGEIKLVEMIVIVAVTIGIFVAIALISKHVRQLKSEWKPVTFYSLSFVRSAPDLRTSLYRRDQHHVFRIHRRLPDQGCIRNSRDYKGTHAFIGTDRVLVLHPGLFRACRNTAQCHPRLFSCEIPFVLRDRIRS